MPRADGLTRSDIDRRQVDVTFIEKLPGIRTEQLRIEQLLVEIEDALKRYKLSELVQKQERPARMVAALKPGLKPAKALLRWLQSLPPSLRLELRAGGIEERLDELTIIVGELAARTDERCRYYQGHVRTNRPFGVADIQLWLREDLMQIFMKHFPNAGEADCRSWVASILSRAGVAFPNEKKNRKRFVSGRS